MPFDLDPEQRTLHARVRALAREKILPRAAAIDESESYPFDNVAVLLEAGLIGATIPKEYGGGGKSFLDAAVIVMALSEACGVTGRIAVETNMGAISAVMQYGSEAQKRLAAGLVLAGDKPAICITEPEAGSAATEMTTLAERRNGGWRINGRKHWITGGGISRLHLIFARAVAGDGSEPAIGGFLARLGDPGLEIGGRERTLGLRGIPETEILFRDLEVPDAMALRHQDGRLVGFSDLMHAYNSQRVGAAAVALGIAEGAFAAALDYARERTQFGRRIGEFQGLQWKLADMAIGLEAARLMIFRAAASGNPFPDPLLAAEAKVLAAETALRVTSEALQIFGARGYSRELALERMLRDVRMFTIGGGTTEILRTLIASRVLGWKLPQRAAREPRAATVSRNPEPLRPLTVAGDAPKR